jgi:hypothetical protein
MCSKAINLQASHLKKLKHFKEGIPQLKTILSQFSTKKKTTQQGTIIKSPIVISRKTIFWLLVIMGDVNSFFFRLGLTLKPLLFASS